MGKLRALIAKFRRERTTGAEDGAAREEARRIRDAVDTQRAAQRQESSRFTGGFGPL